MQRPERLQRCCAQPVAAPNGRARAVASWDTRGAVTLADTTRTSTQSDDEGQTTKRWWLVLVHHDDTRRIGSRVALAEALQLGRKSEVFGAGALDDGHVSRAHAELEAVSGGTWTLRDVGSHNGTYVNGRRIQEHPLVPGDVVGMGRALLLVVREPAVDTAGPETTLVGQTHAFVSTLATIRNAATHGPTVLWGEAGVGKDALARALHHASKRPGALRVLRCGRHEDEATRLAAALEASELGTVVLDQVEELSTASQLVLVDALERDLPQARGVVACTVETPDALAHRLRPELLHRLRRWSIRVPSLTERRADIPRLALSFAQRFSDHPQPRLAPELAFRLLRHRWPGNLHELEAIIERAAVESSTEQLQPFDGLDALLAQQASVRGISTYGRKVEREPFVADAQGQWYTTPGGQRFELGRRKTLARVLATLLDARKATPGKALSVSDMLDRAWPDEKLLPQAGANRVYVAMTTLRKMGLRNLLVRTDTGYVLDPEVPLRIIEA